MSLQEIPGPSDAPPVNSQSSFAPAPSRKTSARILLVEDHPVFAAGLRALFSGEAGFEVVGHAKDGNTAISLVRNHQPDIILLDIEIGKESGLDLINRFRRINPNVRIAVITGHQEPEYLMTAIRLDVQAFIQKDMPGEDMLAAVRQVLKGERVVTQPAAMTSALSQLGQLLRGQQREQSKLTEQELEILNLAAAGYKNKDIGAHKFLSEVTIKRKLQDIYRKLNVTGKPAAVAEAMRLGLI